MFSILVFDLKVKPMILWPCYLSKTINPLSLFMKQIFKMKSGKMSRRGNG